MLSSPADALRRIKLDGSDSRARVERAVGQDHEPIHSSPTDTSIITVVDSHVRMLGSDTVDGLRSERAEPCRDLDSRRARKESASTHDARIVHGGGAFTSCMKRTRRSFRTWASRKRRESRGSRQHVASQLVCATIPISAPVRYYVYRSIISSNLCKIIKHV